MALSLHHAGKQGVKRRGVPLDGVAMLVGAAGLVGHGLAGERIELEPAGEEGDGAGEGVVVDEARAIGGDLGGDVHGVGDEHGDGGGEGFHYRNAEVFLVGGQHEGLSRLEGAPFVIALEHAGPEEGIADGELLGELLEGVGVAAGGGAGHHEAMAGWIPEAQLLEGGHGAQEEIGAFFGVHAAEEEEAAAVGEAGVLGAEGGGVVVGGMGDASGSVGHHNFMAAIEPERLAGEAALLLAGEDHSLGITQGGIHGPGPGEPFLEVPEGEGAFEPGIQHPVGEHHVRDGAAAQHPPCSEEMEAPDAIHHQQVVAVPMDLQPADEAEGEKPVNPSQAQGVNRATGKGEARRAGGVEGGNISRHAWMAVVKDHQLANPLHRATRRGLNRLHHVQAPQGWLLRFGDVVFSRWANSPSTTRLQALGQLSCPASKACHC